MSTVFYYGVIMKRYFCFFLAVLITAMSIIFYCPFNIYANDAFTISKNSTEKTGLSADEAQKAIDANADIKGKDGVTMLLYTPSDSYNYTLKSGAFVAHLSDSQAKAMLMSKKSFQQYVVLCSSLISNGTVFRGFLKTVGIATTGDSNALTNIVDKFTCNYNYLDSINYDEDTQTITMDNTSVDKLREEIKQYYYDMIGFCQWKPSGTVKSFVDSSEYRKNFEFEEDYQNAYYSKSKFCIASSYANYALFYDDKFDYMYLSNSEKKNLYYDGWHIDFYKLLYRDGSDFSSKLVGEDKKGLITRYDANPLTNVTVASLYYHASYPQKMALSPSFILGSDGSTYDDMYVKYYSADGSPLLFFKSYSAYYDFINGDQNAYLSSTIEKTGEDITFSIKDMNENLGNKMDALIDSINSNKSNMSADELQNAIDKGLEDLNKNTEDIKDNTSDILDVLREQNQILLDILGVTTNIYKVVKDSDSKEKTYNINYVQSVFNSMFKGLKNAVLYGENTVRDDVSEDTDDIDSIVSDIPPDKKNYHNGLFGRFPFSVPYQLFDWLQALYVDPVAPKFTLSYAYLFEDLGYETNNFKFIIDLGDEKYSKWIELVRSGEKLSFIIYMAIATYHRFKNEI